jgi:hypothetical protein
MKKLILTIGIFSGLFLITGIAKAGLPMDQMTQNRTINIPGSGTASPTSYTYPGTANWNTSINGSSAPASGSAASIVFGVNQTTFTTNSGVTISTYIARNCITDVTATLSSGSTFFILDGGTTDYVVYGAAIIDFSGATSAEWSKHWDHLGPLCGTAGNTMTLSIPAPNVATTLNAISADGYTVITGLGSNYNLNQ